MKILRYNQFADFCLVIPALLGKKKNWIIPLKKTPNLIFLFLLCQQSFNPLCSSIPICLMMFLIARSIFTATSCHFSDTEQIILINTQQGNLRLLYRQISEASKKLVNVYGPVTNRIQGAAWIWGRRAVIDVCAVWVAGRNKIEPSWPSLHHVAFVWRVFCGE